METDFVEYLLCRGAVLECGSDVVADLPHRAVAHSPVTEDVTGEVIGELCCTRNGNWHADVKKASETEDSATQNRVCRHGVHGEVIGSQCFMVDDE